MHMTTLNNGNHVEVSQFGYHPENDNDGRHPAEMQGMAIGDWIESINGIKTQTKADVTNELAKLSEGDEAVYIVSKGAVRVKAAKLNADED